MNKCLTLGEFLKKLRKGNNLSQESLANMLGITRQAYSKYELGKSEPSMDILMKLSEFYSMAIDKFYGIEPGSIKKHEQMVYGQKAIKYFFLLNDENRSEVYRILSKEME